MTITTYILLIYFLFNLPMQGKTKTETLWLFLVKLFVCPVTKGLQTVAFRSSSFETKLS